jgi:hypothetical protein
MNQKRGQVTLFIIIALVIVALALLVIFFWPKINSAFMSQQQAQQLLASQAEPLRQAVYDCIQTSSVKGFTKMGLQGGYYDTTGLNKISYLGNDFTVEMYKDASMQRINKLPTLSQIEYQYQLFLKQEGNAEIDKCLNNFAGFKRVMNIELGERKITPLIYYDAIVLQVDWEMKISKQAGSNNAQQTINQKQVIMLVPFGYLWQTANKVVDCESQVDCKYEGIEWDKDTWNSPFRLQYINKEAISITKNQIAFLLESIPYRPGEESFRFNFAIDRT